MDDVWVVVPMYNEAKTVGAVVAELRRSFNHVLCVDDGSSDSCARDAAAAGAMVLTHAVNLGQGAALQTGFEYVERRTDAEFCVTFDADGQHRVEDAVRMVEQLRGSDCDLALATRFAGDDSEQQLTNSRRAVLRVAVAFTRLTTRAQITDAHNGLRVIRRSALPRLRLRQPGMAHASELLSLMASGGLKHLEVPVVVRYSDYSRAKGQSNLNAVNILFDLAVARIRSAA
jgi:glycosyltransferase involved in cell wall biosynthesis